LRARDVRFDGRFFVAVKTTHIYCRPICRAGTAKFENCRFFKTAAAAHAEGYRPCLRCRPETAPEGGAWRGTSSTVSRALDLIAEGALDESSVDALAERPGVGERQLRRLFDQHLGASPLAVAQTQRVHLAKQLVHDTQMPMADVALAAGFGSVRRFNETFRAMFNRPPRELRRKRQVEGSGIVVRLRYRAPYDWDAMLAHLRARAITGVEEVSATTYRRHIMGGSIEVTHVPSAESIDARIAISEVKTLPVVIARIRRVFDLDADVGEIGAQLASDPLLASLVRRRPGLRVPGAFDGFELAVRAVLGQQVTLLAGKKLTERLVQICGDGRCFPTATDVARADLTAMPMPRARKQALHAVAAAALGDPQLFEAPDTLDRLRAIKGVGEWTAQYIALRAAREPDAFPASDVVLLRNSATRTAAQLLTRAERWRPFRAYAAQHLWTAGSPP
jgi:AraC family transcriptional regulator of adaptative response / DNA-3-methyladenine glycosylase II